jgi:hypothetical protein
MYFFSACIQGPFHYLQYCEIRETGVFRTEDGLKADPPGLPGCRRSFANATGGKDSIFTLDGRSGTGRG